MSPNPIAWITSLLTAYSILTNQPTAKKRHSTETALLYIHDHLISAIGSQKVSYLCLLDLSAPFDTIDHDILITRLSSWFGIHGSVLSWFKSYLSSHCFRVKCETDLSSCHLPPQGPYRPTNPSRTVKPPIAAKVCAARWRTARVNSSPNLLNQSQRSSFAVIG